MPASKGELKQIVAEAAGLSFMQQQKNQFVLFGQGGGVINAEAEKASETSRVSFEQLDFPYFYFARFGLLSGEDSQFLGMLGMHGTYERKNAMHDCD